MSRAAIPAAHLRLKRVYEKPEKSDGLRILVDRIWPRGLRKEDAALDRWMKEIAPSTGLRQWFGHDPERWPEFQRRYAAELASQGDILDELRAMARQGTVTLLFAAHDEAHNNAVALRAVLRGT